MKTILFLIASLFVSPAYSEEVIVQDPAGDSFIINVNQDDRFVDTVQLLQSQFGEQGEYVLDFQVKKAAYDVGKKAKQPKRNYYAEVTDHEREIIRYVILTLGNGSIATITKAKRKLESAKKEIYHVHPLRFLMTIFTEEDTKAAVAAMDGRMLVWSGFMDGNKESLNKETERNNLTRAMVEDFSAKVGINPDVIWPSIVNKQWDNFIELLLKNIPRAGNPDGYNM